MFIHIFAVMSLEQSISQPKFYSEQEKLMINVIYSANLLNLITTRLFKPFDLSPQQYNVLRILRGQKGDSIALMDIEHRMLDKSSNVSRLIDKLISKDTGLPVTIADNPLECVATGTGKALENEELFSTMLSEY